MKINLINYSSSALGFLLALSGAAVQAGAMYPNHAATSSWNANLGAQSYNMGAGGIRFTV